MSTNAASRNCVVRSGSTWGRRVTVCLAAFVATAALVIWMSGDRPEQAQRYTATATIWHCPTPSNNGSPAPSNEQKTPDPAAIRGQILSDQNLRHALGRLDRRRADQADRNPWAVTDEMLEKVRGQIEVTGAGGSSPDRSGARVTCLERDPDRAIALANVLAEAYAEQHRAKLEATVHQDYLKARDAAELARRTYVEAEARFDDFVAQHFGEQQALAQREEQRQAEREPDEDPLASHPPSDADDLSGTELTEEPNNPSETIEQPDTQPEPTEEPLHVVLGRHLTDLEDHRADLLLSRTPAHPEVQYVDTQIAELEQRLASVRREMPAETPTPPTDAPVLESPVVDGPSATPDAVEPQPEQTVSRYVETVEAYERHKATVDRARQEYDRLSQIKRRAWDREMRATSVELELADGARVCRAANRPPRPSLGALGVALIVALGVGMISSGFDTDLPLTTPAEAQRALQVPVVGKIPARDPAPGRTIRQRSPRARRSAKILGGTLLVAVCFGILAVLL
jgi:hypothetical protein